MERPGEGAHALAQRDPGFNRKPGCGVPRGGVVRQPHGQCIVGITASGDTLSRAPEVSLTVLVLPMPAPRRLGVSCRDRSQQAPAADAAFLVSRRARRSPAFARAAMMQLLALFLILTLALGGFLFLRLALGGASDTRSFFSAPRVDAHFLAAGLSRAFSISLGSVLLPSSLRTLAQETCSSCLCKVNSSALTHRRVNLFRVGSSLLLSVNSWPVIQGVCGCEVNAGHPHSLQTFGVGPYTAHTTVIDLLRLVRGEGARSYFPMRASR